MCLKLDTASFFALHSCLWGAHQLSQDESSILCYHSVFAHCIERTQRASSPARTPTEECREHQKDGEMEDTSHSPEDHRGESPAELACDSMFSQWTLMKPYRILGEILTTPSLLPLLQKKPTAFCFECLVATNPYLIPWVYKYSPACIRPNLPRAVLSSPNHLFSPTVTPPTACLFMWQRGLWNCSVLLLRDSLLHTLAFFFLLLFLSHSFNCFLRDIPIHPQTLTLTPALSPTTQDQSWEWPALNIVVCWQQHGVMWMRPGEAQSGVCALNSCQMFLKCKTVQCF